MLIPLDFITKKRGIFSRDDYEESIEHAVFTERLRKTLYYGETPNKDRPSLPVTELAVGFLQDAAPRQLGKVDLTLASEVSREACISPCSLMLGMIYVERLKHRNPEYLQQVSSSDLFLISMMMASKYLYDEGVDEEVFNDEWAESADMDTEELNSLERDFLRAIDWQLFVKPADFFSLLERIERGIAYTQCKERGFHTYTDLTVLSQHGGFNQAMLAILTEISKVLVVCSVAYLAGVMTMFGSGVTLVYVHHAMPYHLGLPPPAAPLITDPLPATDLLHQTTPTDTVDTNTTQMDSHYRDTQQGTGPHTDTTDHFSDTRPVRIGVTGLLTLAIIKDTLLQFVEGLTPRILGDSGPGSSDEVECKCGCCGAPIEPNKHCVNVTHDNQGLSFGSGWFSKHPGSNELQDQEQKLMTECVGQKCCCRPREPALPWYSMSTRESWLNVPFHNVILGFGTTAEPLVAR